MNCKEVHQHLYEYAEGSLSHPVRRDIEAHLSSCAECALRLQKMQQIIQLLESEKSLEAGPYFYTRLEQRIKNQSMQSAGSLKPVFGWALTALMVFFLLASVSGGVLTGRYAGIKGMMNSKGSMELPLLSKEYFLNDSSHYELENLLLSDIQ